jgi:pyruvate dehydrogenase E1 component
VILDRGMQEMMVEQKDVFYYVTLMNENYAQPDLRPGVEADIIRGCYRFDSFLPEGGKASAEVTLMGSGAILTEVIKAAQQLAQQGIAATVYSVTSWSELARDGAACQHAALKERRTQTHSSRGNCKAAPDPSSPPPTMCAPCPKASAPSCPKAGAT